MPVVSVLHGAVVGGGLELAAATHIRVAETSTYYALPEGSRGIFVGGGGSVRVPRLIGIARMMDMMLTGRTYGAEEGQALGLSHYLVDAGAGLAKGIELATRIAGNTPMTNFAVMHVLPRIAEQDRASGYLTEALIAVDRAGRRRGEGTAQGIPGKARAEDASQSQLSLHTSCPALRRASTSWLSVKIQRPGPPGHGSVREMTTTLTQTHHDLSAPVRRCGSGRARRCSITDRTARSTSARRTRWRPTPTKLTERLEYWATDRAGSHLHGAARRRRRLAPLSYARNAGPRAPHRAPRCCAAISRPSGRS